MVSCKGCPFLADISHTMLINKAREEMCFVEDDSRVCALGYYVVRAGDSYCCPAEGYGCKLSAVTYKVDDKVKQFNIK